MYELMNYKEIMLEIAQKIRTKRIALEYTQEIFSQKSAVSLSTYRTFEKSGTGSFENFIKILTALGSLTELEKILPQSDFSPADIFHAKPNKERLRVKKKKSNVLPPVDIVKQTQSSLLEIIKAKNAKK